MSALRRPPGPTLLPGQQQVFTWQRAFGVWYSALMPELKREAGAIVRNGDLAGEDARDDLVQEAAIRLWHLDPARYGPAERGALRRALSRRMRTVAKSERRHAHESFTGEE